ERALRDAVKRDRARTKILRTSPFGLVEMTRQRVRPSLKRSVFRDCPSCKGTGVVKSAESMAIEAIRLLMLVNDLSLRNLAPAELAKGFGFFQSKPSSAFSPVALTRDELGSAWDGSKLSLPLLVQVNGEELGRPNAGVDMSVDFPRRIAHAAGTRPLAAGTIVGSGTVSNADQSAGTACIAEKRALETIASGEPVTPFLKFGDRVRIEMFDAEGHSLFGAIEQQVARYTPPR
ncbi:MAG: fumarylacetoacetate hydrolase family protein, partial [Burkholderiales bacterium]|nr:fumarylacetoacetate hydrolase family protein [Burkholderiales bacterium]